MKLEKQVMGYFELITIFDHFTHRCRVALKFMYTLGDNPPPVDKRSVFCTAPVFRNSLHTWQHRCEKALKVDFKNLSYFHDDKFLLPKHYGNKGDL